MELYDFKYLSFLIITLKLFQLDRLGILSLPVANTGADILSLFVSDNYFSLNKCTYIVQATIIDSSFRSLYLTDIVGGSDNVTLVGAASFIFTEAPGFNKISILSGILSLTIIPFNGEIIEESITSGASVIINGTLIALSF